jgi:hypothetical protein
VGKKISGQRYSEMTAPDGQPPVVRCHGVYMFYSPVEFGEGDRLEWRLNPDGTATFRKNGVEVPARPVDLQKSEVK